MSGPTTRLSDEDAHKRIEDMLRDENDPKERMRLLLLLRLNDVLTDNVVATRELTQEFKNHRGEFNVHQDKFDQHVADERVLIAKGRVALWVAVGFVGLVQAMGGYIINKHLGELSMAIAVSADNRAYIEGHKKEHAALERRLDALERKP